MSQSKDNIVESLYAAALEQPPEQREAFLRDQCADRPEVLSEVLLLLKNSPPANAWWNERQQPWADGGDLTVTEYDFGGEDEEYDADELTAGQRIGPYHLLEQIGSGGMGVVFRAQQTDPVHREVALKVIRPGMDRRSVIVRFEAERQTLARMDHPGIARIFDAGTTDSRLPYFVMELVQGVRVTTYCQEENLSLADRLTLFVRICSAVTHAHQRGVIHRDLKPSNILVEKHDDDAVPRIIDFGIAKATDSSLNNSDMTSPGEIMGTPMYMSPEQAGVSNKDVDIRTDVYALGVLLYTLLTDRTPFDEERMRRSSVMEWQRIICEETPPRPSVRARESRGHGEHESSDSNGRGSKSWFRKTMLDSELDWIVLKAIEKDRERRYQTVRELALDVQRYQNSEPIVARPPSFAYVVRKAIRRNQSAAIAMALAVFALLVGGSIAVWEWRVAVDAFKQADEKTRLLESTNRELELRRQAADVAQRQAEKLLYVSEIGLADHIQASRDAPKARSVLQRHRTRFAQADGPPFEFRYLDRITSIPEVWKIEEPVFKQLVCSRGGQLAGLTADNRLIFMEAETGRTLGQHTPRAVLLDLTWNPDGTELATMNDVGEVLIYDVDAGQSQTSVGQSDTPLTLTESQRTAEGTGSETLVADKDGQPIRTRFLTDGRLLSARAGSDLVKVWDVTTDKVVAELDSEVDELRLIEIDPNGRWLAAVGAADELKVWDLQSSQLAYTRRLGGRGTAIAFSSQGTQVVAGTQNGRLMIVETQDGATSAARTRTSITSVVVQSRLQTITDGEQSNSQSAIGKNSSPARVIAGHRNGNFTFWDIGPAGKALAAAPFLTFQGHQSEVQNLVLNQESNVLYSSDRFGVTRAWKANVEVDCHVLDGVSAIAFSQSGKLLAVGSGSGSPSREESSDVVSWLPSTRNWTEIQVATTGDRIAATDGTRVQLFRGESLKETDDWDCPAGVQLLTMSQNGERLAWLSDDGSALQLVDLSSDTPEGKRTELTAPFRGCGAMALSPDGSQLAMATENELSLFDLEGSEGPKRLWRAAEQSGVIQCVTFCPNGKTIGTGTSNNLLSQWKAEDGSRISTSPGHPGGITDLSFDASGERLISCGREGLTRIWDAATQQSMLMVYRRDIPDCQQAALSPEDSRLAVLSSNGHVVIFNSGG